MPDIDNGGTNAGGIDTKLEGDPAGLHAAARWATSHGGALESAGTALSRARLNTADWQGAAAEAFSAHTARQVRDADEVANASRRAGAALTTYATWLESAQKTLAGVRSDAATSGLQVVGTTIQPPAPSPARPGPPPESRPGMDVTAWNSQVTTYNAQVEAYNASQRLWGAYDLSATQVADVRVAQDVSVQSLAKDLRGLWDYVKKNNGAMNAGDNLFTTAATAVAGALAKSAKYASVVRAEKLLQEAGEYASMGMVAKVVGGLDDAAGTLFGLAAAAGNASQAATASGDAAEALGKARGLRLGGAFAVAGTVLDIANGERPDQAVVSNGVGFAAATGVGLAVDAGASILASTAAGAALGSAVPVVGTIIGAAAGAVIGTFATGAVASLWDDHPSLGHAWDAGVHTVAETAHAIGDIGHDVGHAASSAWHSLFG